MTPTYAPKWVTIERASDLSGFGRDAIYNWIKLGHWTQGTQWKYNPANRVRHH